MIIVIQVFLTLEIPSRPDRPADTPEQPRYQSPAGNPLQPVCPACKWSKIYTNLESARKGLAAHRQHCKGAWQNVSPFAIPLRHK
jgi:hypothetical protein